MTITVTGNCAAAEKAEGLIGYATSRARRDEILGENENPSQVTFITGGTSMIKEIAEITKSYSTHMSICDDGTLIVLFTGKKPAINQRHMVCQNDYLRENCINYERAGKNVGSEHYNTYRKKNVVKPQED